MRRTSESSADEMRATIMKLTGIALLWVGLAALINVPSAGDSTKSAFIAGAGFFAFAAGLLLLVGALERHIVARLRRDRS